MKFAAILAKFGFVGLLAAGGTSAGFLDDVKDTVGGAVEDATDAAKDAIGGAKDAVGDTASDAKDAIGNVIEGQTRYWGKKTTDITSGLSAESFVELDRSGHPLSMGVKYSGEDTIVLSKWSEATSAVNWVELPEEAAIFPFQAVSVSLISEGSSNSDIFAGAYSVFQYHVIPPLELSNMMPSDSRPCLMPEGWEQLADTTMWVPSSSEEYLEGPPGCEGWEGTDPCFSAAPSLGTFGQSVTNFDTLVSTEYMASLKKGDQECFSFAIPKEAKFARGGYYPMDFCVSATDKQTYEITLNSFEYFATTLEDAKCDQPPVVAKDAANSP
jgi:hypothetical protein